MNKRIRTLLGLALVFLCLPTFTAGQDLGALARAQKEQKQDKEGKKSSKVYTNEDVKSSDAAVQPTSPAGTGTTDKTIAAFTKDGQTVRLAPDDTTDLIFMATWCPHSKHLKQLLNDSRTQSYLAHKKLVFLFADEWHKIKSTAEKTAKSQNISDEDLAAQLEEMKAAGGSPYLYDPKFLDDLPGQHYFCTLPSQVDGFPTVLSTHGFTTNWSAWLADERSMPVELVNQLADRYDPG
jgi:glutaredoxin